MYRAGPSQRWMFRPLCSLSLIFNSAPVVAGGADWRGLLTLIVLPRRIITLLINVSALSTPATLSGTSHLASLCRIFGYFSNYQDFEWKYFSKLAGPKQLLGVRSEDGEVWGPELNWLHLHYCGLIGDGPPTFPRVFLAHGTFNGHHFISTAIALFPHQDASSPGW